MSSKSEQTFKVVRDSKGRVIDKAFAVSITDYVTIDEVAVGKNIEDGIDENWVNDVPRRRSDL